MEKTCLIISGGDYHALPEAFTGKRPGCIIACDRGWQYAERMGLIPDLVVGDFDSAPLPAHLPVRQVPSRKDDTDTLLAIKEALKMGYRRLALLCAFGGRLDHSLANLQAGAFGAARGALVQLWGTDTLAYICGPAYSPLRLPRQAGRSLSLFALGEPVQGLSLKGSCYDGEDLTLQSTFPLGISNCWKEAAAEIAWQEGLLLVMESQLKEGEHIG